MKLSQHFGISEAMECEGHTVVIDVLRAFTNAAVAFEKGVREIFLVSSSAEAFELKKKNPLFLLAGEEHGQRIEGFDFSNSPDEMNRYDLHERTLVLRTSNGTQGVVSAKNAEKIYLGSLVVASATARQLMGLDRVSLLALGSKNSGIENEDTACADFLSSQLSGNEPDHEKTVQRVCSSLAGRQAFDPQISWFSQADLDWATEIDRFSFFMPVHRDGNHLIATKEIG